jgi:hypothetical protein
MEYFKNFNSKDAQDVGFEHLAEMIRSDEELRKNTQLYRDLMAQGNEKAAKAVKESTPQVAVSFRMEGGKGKDSCRECLYQILIDFDAKSPKERLPAEELERVKTFLRTSYHARLGYESISGLGYHIVVPFVLPEGIDIDMTADQKRAEDIYTRVYQHIVRLYTVWTGHEMDRECKNVNRMMGLSHDPIVVYRPDATPIRMTREELGIDKDGQLVRMKTPKHAVDQKGNPVSVPLGDHLERAMRMMEDAGITFTPGNRHNYVMRLAFVLNRMGVDEDEAAQALDNEWLGQMDGRPSDVLHSCYKTARDEFGMWMPQRSTTAVKTEIIASFLKTKQLQYDVLTQKTRQLITPENSEEPGTPGHWQELKERQENDLFMACCQESGVNLTEKLFHTVLNSSVVPEVNPLRAYQTDHIDIDRLDKDEELRAAEYGLINIDELDKLTDRQLNKLKSMITTEHVDVRAPFGRHKEKRVRVATYAASGNKEEFLTDQTGNRRWLPFHVDSIDSPYTHRLPYDGMFAQALYLLRDSFNYWFDEADIRAIEHHVEAFMVPTSEEELVPLYFSPARQGDTGVTFLTLAEISAKISMWGNLKKNPDPRRLGAIMTNLGFTKERSGHGGRRGYYVREHLQSEIDQMRHPEIF